jgi:hypothetical protein
LPLNRAGAQPDLKDFLWNALLPAVSIHDRRDTDLGRRRIWPFARDGNEHVLDLCDESGHPFDLGTATSVGLIGVSRARATQRAGNCRRAKRVPNGMLWGEVLWPSI